MKVSSESDFCRSHKRAFIAIARMIFTCIYPMSLKKEAFNPSDTNYSDILEGLYKNIRYNILKSIELLEKEGCVITPPAASA